MRVGRVSHRELLRCGGPGPGAALLVGSCVVSVSPSALGGGRFGTHADVTPMLDNAQWTPHFDGQGASGRRGTKGKVSSPMMWPHLKETALYLRTAGGMTEGGCGSSPVRRSRTLSRTKEVGGSVTPSVHLAVPDFLSVT